MVALVYQMDSADLAVNVRQDTLDNVVKIVRCTINGGFSHLNISRLGVDPCASQPCRNGATCRPVNGNSYQCICPPGYSGADCSIRKFSFCIAHRRKIIDDVYEYR